MESSEDRRAQIERLQNDLTPAWIWALLVWTLLPVGVDTIVTGRGLEVHDGAFFEISPLWEGVFEVAIGLAGLGYLAVFRRVAAVPLWLFYLLALASAVAASQQSLSVAIFTGIGAYLALIWFYVTARRDLRATVPIAPAQDHAAQLVFYMLDSEEQELALADRILACSALTGIDDFVSDYDPQLSVESVVQLIAEADALLARDGLDIGRKDEITDLKQRVRANGRAYVGYQFEAREQLQRQTSARKARRSETP